MADLCIKCAITGVRNPEPCPIHPWVERKTDDGLHALSTTTAGAKRMIETMREARESS